MSGAKLTALNSTDVMTLEEGNDSRNTLIRQSIAKEPFLSFSRPNDSHEQWIQLLRALDHQEFQGWPFLSSMKVQMHKCKKCSREFCSSINFRRHMRVQHRFKKLDKDSVKNRDLLREFWDMRSEDEMKEILSFKDVKEDVTGFSIVQSLTTLIRKPVISLSRHCFQTASALLDIIQARPSKFPLSSEKLFGILDEASEKTFLSGSAVSIKKYMFDGEAGKIGLETKNLIGCTSFLVEQKLVKAYLADKDAEALRCQKLLVEEEEAAQRRKAEILQRKRQKKLRLKALIAKEQREEGEKMLEESGAMAEAGSLAAQSRPLSTSDSSNNDLNLSLYHCDLHCEFPNMEKDADSKIQTRPGSGNAEQANAHIVEQQATRGSGRRHSVVSKWHPLKLQQNHLLNGFHSNQNFPAAKFSTVNKNGIQRDQKPSTLLNGSRRWSRKPKAGYAGKTLTAGVNEALNQLDHNKKHELLIGSISVSLGKCNSQETNVDGVRGDYTTEDQLQKKTNPREINNGPNSGHGCSNRSTVKLWKPVSGNGSKHILLNENGTSDSQSNFVADKAENQFLSDNNLLRSYTIINCNYIETGNNSTLLEAERCPENFCFSSEAARAFLAERWKDAIAADHVKLVLFRDHEHSRVCSGSDTKKALILSTADNIALINGGSRESNLGTGRANLKAKPEKGVKLRYIPKQRTPT